MSILVTNLVWIHFPGGGSRLLVLLALGDFANDQGQCYPSISTIAKKIRLSRSQAQRSVHCLISDGFVKVIGNEYGGAQGSSRRYQINLGALACPTNDTRIAHATGSADASEGSQACLITSSTDATQIIIEPSIPLMKVSSKTKSEITLREFLEICKENGERAISEFDTVFEYAEKVGIEHEMVIICWQEFKAAYLQTNKKYVDWRAAFRNAVRNNYYHLWYCKADEPITWTSKGQQARRAAS